MKLSYLTRRMLRRDHFFQTMISEITKNPLYRVVLSRPRHSFYYPAYLFAYLIYFVTSANVRRTKHVKEVCGGDYCRPHD
jgi:hypothetical protein